MWRSVLASLSFLPLLFPATEARLLSRPREAEWTWSAFCWFAAHSPPQRVRQRGEQKKKRKCHPSLPLPGPPSFGRRPLLLFCVFFAAHFGDAFSIVLCELFPTALPSPFPFGWARFVSNLCFRVHVWVYALVRGPDYASECVCVHVHSVVRARPPPHSSSLLLSSSLSPPPHFFSIQLSGVGAWIVRGGPLKKSFPHSHTLLLPRFASGLALHEWS